MFEHKEYLHNFLNLKWIENIILHFLNWILITGLFVGTGMLMEYLTKLYSIYPLVALPYTIVVLILLSLPFNYIENKIDNL